MKKLFSIYTVAVVVNICVGCAFAHGNYDTETCQINSYYELAEQKELFKVYDSRELTTEILTSRKGSIIVEKVVGKCVDATSGDGVVLGKETEYYNYISYKNVPGVKTNDVLCTYLVYNPDNNYEDDIIERYDFIIDSMEKSKINATVDRIEGDTCVIETSCRNSIRFLNIKQEDFNQTKSEGEKINAKTIDGKFEFTGEWTKHGLIETYYQFKSRDNSVWWALTDEEIGFIPREGAEYTLMYYDNDTTAENKPCKCKPVLECECEVYDDIFLGIFEKEDAERK